MVSQGAGEVADMTLNFKHIAVALQVQELHMPSPKEPDMSFHTLWYQTLRKHLQY